MQVEPQVTNNSMANQQLNEKVRETLSLDDEQKQLARHLFEKSGVQFEAFNRDQFFASLTGLISPLDYALWGGVGFVGGIVFVVLLWFGVVAPEQGGTLAQLGAFVATALAIGYGFYIAACAVAVYVYRTTDSLIEASFRSVQEVRQEISTFSPSALKKLSRSEVARGTIWLVTIPAIGVLLRRRLKLRILAAPASMIIRKTFRTIMPPMPDEDGRDDTEQFVRAMETEVAPDAKDPELPGVIETELTPEKWQSWLRTIRWFGAITFGGLAIVQACGLITLAYLGRLVL